MKMSVREARANFAHALDAAERGEPVSITRNGKTVAELVPAKKRVGFDFARSERIRKELGFDKYDHLPRDDKLLDELENDDSASREFWGEYFDHSPVDDKPA